MSADHDQAMSLLTEEEIAAMNDEGVDADKELLSEIVGDDADDLDIEEDDTPDDPADKLPDGAVVDEDGNVVNQPTNVEPIEAPKPTDLPKIDRTEFKPQYVAPEIDKQQFPYTAEEVDGYVNDLAAKFKEGEIDFDEYTKQTAAANDYKLKLDRALLKAEISNEMRSQSGQQEWAYVVKGYLGAVKSEIDYNKDVAKAQDLDMFVRRLGADPANNDKPAEWFLAEAHRRVKALHGVATTVNTPAAKPQGRKAPTDAIPATLAHVQGAAENLTDNYANLDKMDGLDLEAALARMSKSERDKYLGIR